MFLLRNYKFNNLEYFLFIINMAKLDQFCCLNTLRTTKCLFLDKQNKTETLIKVAFTCNFMFKSNAYLIILKKEREQKL